MAIDQLPEISVSGALFSAALTTAITGILRPLAEAKPDAYLPDLASGAEQPRRPAGRRPGSSKPP